MNINEKGVLSVAAILGVLAFAYAYNKGGGNIPAYVNQPGELVTNAGFNAYSWVSATLNAPLETVSPHNGTPAVGPHFCYDNAGTICTPHRYPHVSGGNISLLIHKGWDPLMNPPTRGASWYVSPPAELDISG